MTLPHRAWHPWIRGGLGIALSVAFVVVTISRVDLAVVGHAWAEASHALLGVAAAASIAEVMVRAVRWRILLRPFVAVSFGAALAFLSIGHLANAILPARLGDVARAVMTGGHTRSSRASVLGTIAVERIADAALLGLAAAAGVIVGYRELAPAIVALPAVGLVAAAIGLSLALILGRAAVAATRAGERFLQYGRRFVAGASALREVTLVVRIGSLTGISFVLAVTVMFVVSSSVGLRIELWQAALAMAAVTLSTAIPAGPAAIGTYEFAGTTVLTAMGHPAPAALLAVALVHVSVTLPPALIGLGSMWLLGIRPVGSPLSSAGRRSVERAA